MMKSKLLFSHKYKPLGWFFFIVGVILGIVFLFDDSFLELDVNVFPLIGDSGIFSENSTFEWSKNNVLDEIISVLIIIGGLLVAFSKTKDEDEYISKIRMESLIWATYVNYGVLLIAVIFVFDMSFFSVMMYNMFTVLLFFIIRFHFLLYKNSKDLNYEE